ncbi:HAD domain-containing protein [Nocardiopsis aegyptia]|uniref:HAD domain-containing protein n=1 Tax=Nocardiopsis aegyptia TaxID=220378 RepID=UPI00366B6AC6
MIGGGGRPLLFLDVDGPLLPFGASAGTHPWRTGPDAHLARLSPEAGRRLAALPCALVWATTWGDLANTEIAPRIGLPRLPVVGWPEPSEDHERVDHWFGLHWKTRALVDWAAGRPFAWVDDEITGADREWVLAHHGDRAVLHRVDPSRGLTDADFTALDQALRALWAHGQGGP